MKTTIQQNNRQGKLNRPVQKSLSIKDAITWFLITVIALCLTGTAQAKSFTTMPQAPVANNVMMTPLVQISPLLPLSATTQNGVIGSFTLVTIPSANQGTLYLEMNGELVEVSEGMMLTADLGSKLVFEPDTLYNGNVVFTFNASDEDGYTSNDATYTIPVIAKQTAVLPIQLLQFNAEAQNKKVQLNWLTEHDNNTSHFEIQRSSNGLEFETISVTSTKSNAAISKSYQSTDDLFFYSFNVVHYRLKIINQNGSFTYSNTVAVRLHTPEKSNLTAWPMPFTSNLNVSLNSEEAGPVKITIHNVNGSVVMTASNIVKKGVNTISLYQAQTLPSGTYLLTISNNTKAQTIKVVKQ